MKKYLLLTISIGVFIIIARIPVAYNFVSFDNPKSALKFNGEVEKVIDQITIDRVTVYFYINKDGRLSNDYVYKTKDGYKASSVESLKIIDDNDFDIRNIKDKHGFHIILFEKSSTNSINFVLQDNIQSTFHEVIIERNGYYITYYIAIIKTSNDYKVQVNGQEVNNWKDWTSWHLIRW